jgi:hypothetical protein
MICVPASTAFLERAASAPVFFGHQSVGENLLEGVRTLIGPRALAWTDARIGENEYPLSKLEAFRTMVTEGPGRDAGLAFFKFCYVDFHARTDVDRLFDAYTVALRKLARARPATVFGHVTVPLTTVSRGPRAWLTRRLGRPVWGEAENEKRHAFNELLRHQYGGRALFDLARFEAGDPRKPQRYERHGKSIPMLWSAYSQDGGHLNDAGKLALATELLRFVATQLPDSSSDRLHPTRGT